MTPPEAAPRGKRALQLALGIAISAAVVWYTFRKTDWAASWQYMVAADRLWIFLAVVLATLPFPLRVPRWRWLLHHEDGRPVGWLPAWHAIAMGFAANNVLPLRAGEVVRMGAVSRLGRVPFAAALSSIAVERVMDALVAMGLLSLALTRGGIDPSLTLPGKSKPLAEIATTIGALGLAALIVAALAAWRRETTLGVARKLLPRNRIGDALYHFGERILLGISALSDPRTALPVVGWSLVVWLCNAAAFYAAFKAFGFAIPFSGALIVQGVVMIGIAAPQAPGYFGVFELTIGGTLAALYQIPLDAGIAYGLMYHVTTFVPITLMGAWSAVTTGFRREAIPEAAA
ncbi:MAG: flippase-like domain-containing protein [Gemmatimonadetes bacterium]|nr:flippase-like domain-containing protein [Gemmatimonadota bacterium]